MSKIKNVKTSQKDKVIDQSVKAVGLDDSAWDEEIEVIPKTMPTSIRLSPRTIQRAKFFARIHHARGYQSWLKRIVEERIQTEFEVYKRFREESL